MLVSSDFDLISTDDDNIPGFMPFLPQDMSYIFRSKKIKTSLKQLFLKFLKIFTYVFELFTFEPLLIRDSHILITLYTLKISEM